MCFFSNWSSEDILTTLLMELLAITIAFAPTNANSQSLQARATGFLKGVPETD